METPLIHQEKIGQNGVSGQQKIYLLKPAGSRVPANVSLKFCSDVLKTSLPVYVVCV